MRTAIGCPHEESFIRVESLVDGESVITTEPTYLSIGQLVFNNFVLIVTSSAYICG